MCITLSTTHAHFWCGPCARGDEEQIARGQVGGDLVGDRHRERAREVVDRVGADVLEPRHLVVGLGVELVEAQEPVDLGVVGERQPVPVDHRVAAQHQAHGIVSASVSSSTAGGRATRGRTVATTADQSTTYAGGSTAAWP